MRTLHERSASTQDLKYFAREVRALARRGPLLEYQLLLEREGRETYLRACRRDEYRVHRTPVQAPVPAVGFLRLRPVTYERARALAPRHDIYALEVDWREATERNGVELRSPDAAFLAWCRTVGKSRSA
jgi:hypothetical protein